MKAYRRKTPDPTRWIRLRIVVVGTALALCFMVIVCRAFQLQVMERNELSEKAEGQYKKAVQRMPRRGTIYDQNTRELAVSIDVSSVCAYPRSVSSSKQTSAALARVLNLDKGTLQKKLSSDKNFVWIKRHANPREVSAIKTLKLDGVGFVTESRRYYPMKSLAAQVLGFCGTDRRGLEGLEYYYEPFLSGRQSRWTVFRDALGRPFKLESTLPETKDGYNLILTIDNHIQHIAEQALADAVQEFSAKSGMALVMAPETGAILAMAHVPHFNPNAFGRYEPWKRRNRVITDSFEPGSTFKIFLAAAALESGRCSPDSTFDCEEGRFQVGKNIVHDVHARGVLSFKDILKYSSNIGAAKIGARIGSEYLYRKLQTFGFGVRTGIDCPGETPGSLIPLERWSDMDALAVCFGQSVSVSALQLASAVSATANGGVLMKPYLVQAMTDRHGRPVKSFPPTVVRRVISPEAARNLSSMLERVVAKGGTGQKAALSGYRAAGKTGTAQKVERGAKQYARDKYTATFVGFIPARDPALVILVVIDEPKKQHYGGVVAAPAFRQIARESLQYLKIPPELVIPEDMAGAIRASRAETWAG